MKKILLTILTLSIGLYGSSQYYYFQDSTGQNPGGLNMDSEFPSGSGLPAGWVEALAGSQASPVWSGVKLIPFSFSFNGSAVTQYKVSSSGVLTFSTSATSVPAYASVSLPSSTIPDSSVCILGLKGTGSNDKIMTKTFGTVPNRQHWIFFTSYSAVSTTSWTYWSIVLEESTNKIYIVDQRHGAPVSGLSLGIQVNSTTAYSVAGSPSVNSRAIGNLSGQNDNVFYEFNQGTQPAYDLDGKTSSLNKYVMLGNAPFTIAGTMKNKGTATVTSYDMNYKVGSGSVVTANVTGASIPTLSTGTFSHPTGWNPTTLGVYSIKAWASNLNGNADLVPANDTISFSVEVLDTFIIRKTLLEVFTSSTCGPCLAGNQKMDNVVLPQINNYTVIKYQQNFPGAGDPYSTTTSVARRGFYGVNSIPRMEIDGAWDLNASSFSASVFKSFQEVPAYISIDITSARIYQDDINVTANITNVDNLSGNLKYHVVITEKKTVNNVATNGETEFFNVMMDMLPTGGNGVALSSLSDGGVTNVNVSTDASTLNVEGNGDLKAVVFVQDMTTKKIYQSEWQDIITTLASVEELEGKVSFNLYPNPSNGIVTLNYTKGNDSKTNVTIVDMVGKTVYSFAGESMKGSFTKNLDLSHLPSGIYMVNIVSNNVKTTKKLVIQ